MQEPKMQQVDISIILYNRGMGKIKNGKYKYIIFCKEYPIGKKNPVEEEAEVKDTTGHRLALQCLIAALKRMHRPSLLTIHTDCMYLQNGYVRIPKYRENGWKRSNNQELRNADLWQQADRLLKGHAVRFKNEYMEAYK